VAEQVRTFGGQLFRLNQHLARLEHSLEIVGVDPGISMSELADVANEVASRNHALMDPGDDLGLAIFVTPGAYTTMTSTARAEIPAGPTVCVHTYPLPFQLWAETYRTGQSLVVSDVRQVPAECWPPELKCRSRMHYYLADSKARHVSPGARALLLDDNGYVLEASTANIVVFRRQEGLVSPPRDKILPGISVAVVAELAESLGIAYSCRDLTVDDVLHADEVMLCSTSPCVWPVASLNGQAIAGGVPGQMCVRLLAAWSELAGLDILAQAERFAAVRWGS
jgi:branched-chain amino acid aminotransferase